MPISNKIFVGEPKTMSALVAWSGRIQDTRAQARTHIYDKIKNKLILFLNATTRNFVITPIIETVCN